MAKDRYVVPVTIASGASLSGPINVNANDIVGIEMPAGWDAASITFAALVADGTTYGKVQTEAGTEKTVTSPAAGVYIYFDDPIRCAGIVKVRSGVAATPVNQTADRVLKLVLARSD